jgi:cytochrome P450
VNLESSTETKSVASYCHYDHHDNEVTLDSVHRIWDELRGQCPVGRSDAHGGMWVVTGYPETVSILRDPGTFSSYPATLPPFPSSAPMLPIEIDPPDHVRYRALVAEPFSPRRAPDYEPQLRANVNHLIDDFIEAGEADLFQAVAVPLPALLATMMLGVPAEDAKALQTWIHSLVHEAASDPEAAGAAIVGIYGYFQQLLELRRVDPSGDDLLSLLLRAEIEGTKLTEEELLGFSLFLLLASIDTTQKVIGSLLWQLANDPDLRGKLVANAELIPAAVEEFLRYWAPVVGARRVTKDTQVDGVEMKEGDRVLLLLGAANRDERAFDDAGTFSLDRPNNKHIAFGGHIHRCLGFHLARLELQILVREFLRRIPTFEPQPGEAPAWSIGQVQGVVRVPVRFPAGEREDSPTPVAQTTA